ncbi:MAG: pyridoxal phosphate-dependent aminotransferase, partial [Phycisphaerales bacterium]|nr:pyridoxal phosphate-dependent aminotransferase [Phycisphaerales bacterium]
RRAFELGASLENPINLSIGQPHFPVPQEMKNAAIEAIQDDRNGYTVTQGIEPLRDAIARHLEHDVGWSSRSPNHECMVTSGTSGGLLLASMALLDVGDEAVVPDPYFVIYPQLGPMTGGKVVTCDTYPDFRMTAERVEPLLTDRTKFVLVNSPSNPTGTVLTAEELGDLVDLCRSRGVLLISDEIYDEFVFEDSAAADGTCPSPARFTEDMLLIRGFGKTHGCTGWRMGYAAGPPWLIAEMRKLQQYTFVCAPTPLQWGAVHAFDSDTSEQVAAYAKRRDMVMEALSPHASVARPGGAFYAFFEVPEHLGMGGGEFTELAASHRVLLVPGSVFSSRDSHVRLSFAVIEDTLVEGLEILARLLQAPG